MTTLQLSSTGAQPILKKSLRGLGHIPNKFARVYKHEHCLPSVSHSWQAMRSGYRRALLAKYESSGVGPHRICLLFRKSHDRKRHFLNGNRRQPPPWLLQSEPGGRCQWRRRPFILTIDGARLVCYPQFLNRNE